MKPDLLPKSPGEDDARKTRNARPAVAGALQARRQGARHETIDGTGKRNNRYVRRAGQEGDHARQPATGVTHIRKENPAPVWVGLWIRRGGSRFRSLFDRTRSVGRDQSGMCWSAQKANSRAKRRLNIED